MVHFKRFRIPTAIPWMQRASWVFGLVWVLLPGCGDKNRSQEAPKSKVQAPTPAEQLQDLNRRIAMNPQDAAAYGARADWWLSEHRLQDERPLPDSASADNPGAALGKALQDIKSALLLDTSNALYYSILGEIYTRMGLVSEADDALRVAMARNPELVRAYLRRGELALINRQYSVAFRYLNEALRRDKRLAEAYLLKGMTHLELKDTLSARSAWLTAIEQNPNLYAAYLELGLLETDPGLAHRYFSNVLELRPGHDQALYARAMLLQQLGLNDSARAEYRRLLRIQPRHRDALFNLAYLDLLERQYGKALAGYDEVIALNPEDVPALYNRGLCYEMQQQHREAAGDYRECLRLNKNYVPAGQALQRLK